MFRRRFIIATALTLPLLLLSPTIQEWTGIHISLPFHQWILVGLSLLIFMYGGGPFLQGAYHEIRGGQPGMMTLIAMAVTVAMGYSFLSLTHFGGKSFFWEMATLVDVMLLGHWIEAKSVAAAGNALEALSRLLPSEATRLNEGKEERVPVDALKNGDDNVWFIDGENLFKDENRDCCTVDGVHPNDAGFVRMAEVIGNILGRLLK